MPRSAARLSFRDPIHGFIRTDALEAALVASRPLQRLRFVRQLGLTFLIYPGAEHSRFNHVLGTMHLAGRVYDALAERPGSPLDPSATSRQRRLVRVAALVHDIGHAPFSHTAEDLFDQPIDHEEMTRRLLGCEELRAIFERHGDGVDAAAVVRVLSRTSADERELLLSEIISGELDVDKMDYLLRDSLYCGVRYGSFDLERLIDTMAPLRDPQSGAWHIGVDAGGVHALEALVMARYYMFTQVYFNPTGKVMELHLNAWLRALQHRWPSTVEGFLAQDDVTVFEAMRRSDNLHARAILARERFVLAYESREHLSAAEAARLNQVLPNLSQRYGQDQLLIDRSAKDPHRLGASRVPMRAHDGTVQMVSEASDFIAHLSRIEMVRVYSTRALRDEVAAALREALARPRGIAT